MENAKTVEAVQFDECEWPEWLDEAVEEGKRICLQFYTFGEYSDGSLQHATMLTPEGWTDVEIGDWITYDSDGNFEVYSDEEFNEKFERVKDDTYRIKGEN